MVRLNHHFQYFVSKSRVFFLDFKRFYSLPYSVATLNFQVQIKYKYDQPGLLSNWFFSKLKFIYFQSSFFVYFKCDLFFYYFFLPFVKNTIFYITIFSTWYLCFLLVLFTGLSMLCLLMLFGNLNLRKKSIVMFKNCWVLKFHNPVGTRMQALPLNPRDPWLHISFLGR